MYTWPGGKGYKGQFVEGIMHGKGTYKWSSGKMYSGNFVNGKRKVHYF